VGEMVVFLAVGLIVVFVINDLQLIIKYARMRKVRGQ
jgi:hypothetical protein